MNQLIVSKNRAVSISNGAFLVCLGILVFTNFWWPGILAAIWVALGLRQYLTGRYYYALITTVILGGLFFLSLFNAKWDYIFTILLLLAGIFIIIRETYFTKDTNGEDKADEIAEDADLENRS